MQTGACPRTPPTSEEGRPRSRQRGFRQRWPLGRLEGSTQGPGQRKKGTGWEGGPGPRRAPKELPGNCAACERVKQLAHSYRTVQGGLRRAGQRLQSGHTAAGAWHQEHLGLCQLVPTAVLSPRGRLATAQALPCASWPGTTPGPPSRSSRPSPGLSSSTKTSLGLPSPHCGDPEQAPRPLSTWVP